MAGGSEVVTLRQFKVWADKQGGGVPRLSL